MTLARADALVVTAGVEAAARQRVSPGNPVVLEAVNGGSQSTGSVVRVDGMINPKSRLVSVILGGAPGLLAGETYRAVITVGQFQGWLAPRDAVLSDAKGPYLFQVAGGKANRVDVKIVGSAGGTTVVDGPLDPAQPLIVVGNYQLSAGQAVRAGARTP
jgi:hypothetical protein